MINSRLKYLFGPVPSRRLGRSLGINITPSKVCSMDCIYCEVGVTTLLTDKISDYFKAKDILAEFDENYESFKDSIDVVTITASGEPTLNSELDIILAGLRKLTDKKIAILTNSTMLKDSKVFDTLLNFDIVVPSLDAVTQGAFNKINKPCSHIDINQIITDIIRFSNQYNGELLLEILFVKGINDSDDELEKMIATVKKINCSSVDISTIYRPPAYKDARALTSDELNLICNKFTEAGVKVRGAKTFDIDKPINEDRSEDKDDIFRKITALLRLRPVTEDELIKLFHINDNDIKVIESNPDIVKSYFNDRSYYHDRRLRINK